MSLARTLSKLFSGGATGALQVPSGTTAQRPAVASPGMTRFNTDIFSYEVYTGNLWQSVKTDSYNIDYLVVAGGGSGNNGWINDGTTTGGGGGGGGMRTGSTQLVPGTAYSVLVGAGGAWVSVQDPSPSGNSSSLGDVVSLGGGGGGKQSRQGQNGGSGGGGGGGGGYSPGGAGTVGQGNAGAAGVTSNYQAGGGGGAGSAASGGTGGAGASSSITDSAVTYAAGGNGGSNSSGNGVAGAAATGNGARGGSQGSGIVGANGGSGVVVIRYLGVQKGTGGTVTSASGYTIHTFTSSGTFTA